MQLNLFTKLLPQESTVIFVLRPERADVFSLLPPPALQSLASPHLCVLWGLPRAKALPMAPPTQLLINQIQEQAAPTTTQPPPCHLRGPRSTIFLKRSRCPRSQGIKKSGCGPRETRPNTSEGCNSLCRLALLVGFAGGALCGKEGKLMERRH